MRYFGRLLTTLASLLLIAAFATAPASAASNVGTHAWSTQNLTLRSGPGTAYALTGQIAEDLAIRVLRCQRLWCLVDGQGGRGWTYKHGISFGRTSTPWPGGVNPNYAVNGSGSICFYQGANYTGQSLCLRSDRTIRDLALLGLDNRFSSVKVEGAISAAVCRDRDFSSYCERITASQPVLDRYLRRALSSIRVH